MAFNRDRERPHNLPLPHHRTNGSRIRRFGRLGQRAQHTAPARQPERHLRPHQRRLHSSHRACAPWARRMHGRRSLASNFSSLSLPSRGTVRAFSGLPPTTPFADFFLAVRGNPFPLSQFPLHAASQGTRKISRGKTQNVPRIDAEFIKHTLLENGGLRGYVPARPEHATPQIRFVYLAPRFWIGLPSDPTSR